MTGRIFDIEEFAVYDGPGIRTVVFFKGCPLSCIWCHNPEGLDAHPTRMTDISLCTSCGKCNAACPLAKDQPCTGCLSCVRACPNGLVSIVGTETEARDIASRVFKNAEILKMNQGGITFSGGEPLLQSDFLIEIRNLVRPLHAAIETSGYANSETFLRVIHHLDYVIMDLKVIDNEKHRKYTGVSNEPILKNLSLLKESGIPFRINIPLIPSVNDDRQNMEDTACLLEGAHALDRVCLLPYNRAAGAKYKSAGKIFRPPFDEAKAPEIHTQPFEKRRMEVTVL